MVLLEFTVRTLDVLAHKLIAKVDEQNRRLDVYKTKMVELDRKFETLLISKSVAPGARKSFGNATHNTAITSCHGSVIIPETQHQPAGSTDWDSDTNISVIPETQIINHNNNQSGDVGAISEHDMENIHNDSIDLLPTPPGIVQSSNNGNNVSTARYSVSSKDSTVSASPVTPHLASREEQVLDSDKSYYITSHQPPPTPDKSSISSNGITAPSNTP